MDITIPDRVVFLNIKDGNAFFDCTPSEARIAREFIKDIRANKQPTKGEAKAFLDELTEAVEVATTAKPIEIIPAVFEKLSLEMLADGFAAVEKYDLRATHVVLNAATYSIMRKWGHEHLTVFSERWKLLAGAQASLWGAIIIVTRRVPTSEIVICGLERKLIAEQTEVNAPICVKLGSA